MYWYKVIFISSPGVPGSCTLYTGTTGLSSSLRTLLISSPGLLSAGSWTLCTSNYPVVLISGVLPVVLISGILPVVLISGILVVLISGILSVILISVYYL